jgi:hypothetical protein
MCNNATYYFNGLEQLLSDEKPENVEDLKMQILDGGINVLLDMYQEVKMNKGNNRQFNNPKSNNIKKKFNFKL